MALPVKVADLCSASSCKASHFCLRVKSLTFACSPSSPGWASTNRGPSNIMESILCRRSVRRRCKSCKTTEHAQVKPYFMKSKGFIIDGGVYSILPLFVERRKLPGKRTSEKYLKALTRTSICIKSEITLSCSHQYYRECSLYISGLISEKCLCLQQKLIFIRALFFFCACLCVSVQETLSCVSSLHCQEPDRFHLIQRAHNGCDYS